MPPKFYPCLKSAVSAAALILSILRAPRPLLIAALFFCICGDLFLAWSGELQRAKREPFFTLGIGAFGVAHVFLILYFTASFGLHWEFLFFLLLACILPAGIRAGFIVPGEYLYRIVIYGIIVSLMLAAAIRTPVFPPAFLFWVSDALLSVWYFHPGTPFWIGGAALVIYYLSLFLMI